MAHVCAGCKREVEAHVPFCPSCGADLPEEPTPDPLIGTMLAKKFRILSMLGEGGMGRVYKAEQQPLSVEVCIKTLHPHLNRDRTVVKRFFREAQAASKLRHPNSVAIFDFGEYEGTFYIAMELLRGQALADVMARDQRMEPRRVGRIMSQVLDVLEAAHRMQIVHRDLKPENVMLEDLPTHKDFVKVLDFGIAKVIDPLSAGSSRLTRTGMVFGTPAYMAPEQAQALEIDARADLYSVGVMLFELLTGELPFEAPNSASMLAKHVSEPPPPLRRKRPDLSAELASLVDRTLSKHPDGRPATALELKGELERALGIRDPRQDSAPQPAARRAATSAVEAAPPAPSSAAARAAQAPAGFARTEAASGTKPRSGPVALPAADVICTQCGSSNPGGSKFCGECGAPSVRGARALEDKLADLRRFLPSQVVDEVAQVRTRVAGEKREVVALSIDVGGAAVHLADPEAAAAARAQFAGAASDVALRHGGTMERAVGEQLLVMFGVPVAHADDAERAVRCALAVRNLAGELSSGRPHPITASMGVHAGQVLIGATMSGGRPDYTPVGDAVDLAKRLADAAEAGQILISEKIYKWCRGSVGLRPLPPLAIKGRAAAISVFEVTGARAHGGAAVGGQLEVPPLCGRRAEMETLTTLAADLRAGQVVHVAGEPGSGKTRLLEEAAKALPGRGVAAHLVTARPPDDGASQAIQELLRGCAAGSGMEAFKQLGMPPPELRFLAPFLGAGERPRWLGEKELRAGTVAAVASALERIATRTPLAVLIDDVQLADPVTADLARRLVTAPLARVLVVLALRTGYDPPWRDARVTTTLTLGPLPDAAIEGLVEGALAPTPPPIPLRDAVRERAGGSPFVATELLRSMIDVGLLVQTGGRWSVTGDPSTFPVPEGARALVAARLDALSTEARFVLTVAAVIGDEFPIDVVTRVASTNVAPEKILASLHARGLVVPSGPGKFRFAQPQVREVAYGRLLQSAREQLHRRIGGAFEAALADGGAAPWDSLGFHFFLGDDRERALKYLALAADEAIAARDTTRAIQALRRAREAARKDLDGAAGAARSRRLAEDSLKLGELLLDAGELAEADKVLADGLVHARRDDDPALIAKVRRARGRTLVARGDLDEAARDLDGAMQGALGLRDRELLAEVHGDLGELYERRGDLNRAAEYLLRAIELSQGGTADAIRRAALRMLNALGRIYLRWKNPDKAAVFFQQALELAQQIDDRLGAERALGNLGAVWHAKGQLDTAAKFVEQALSIAQEIGDQVGLARQHHNLGTILFSTGNMARAQASFDAAYAAARRVGWREGMATAAASLDRLRAAGQKR